jgi:hypothetical protein
LCQVSSDVVAVSGAGIMLMTLDVPRGSVCTSDEVSTVIEDIQYSTGEGPCVEAYHQDRPIVEPDLAQAAAGRWSGFAPAAVDAGAGALFAFPLRLGAIRLGALNLYRDHPGPLSDDQHADALVMADVAARAVLAMQADASPGALGAELESSDLRFVVHQASGMVSVQQHVSVGEALIRLRAYAFANERLLSDVAEDVVAGRVRLE